MRFSYLLSILGSLALVDAANPNDRLKSWCNHGTNEIPSGYGYVSYQNLQDLHMLTCPMIVVSHVQMEIMCIVYEAQPTRQCALADLKS